MAWLQLEGPALTHIVLVWLCTLLITLGCGWLAMLVTGFDQLPRSASSSQRAVFV